MKSVSVGILSEVIYKWKRIVESAKVFCKLLDLFLCLLQEVV